MDLRNINNAVVGGMFQSDVNAILVIIVYVVLGGAIQAVINAIITVKGFASIEVKLLEIF
jgi:hypothetical protein